MEIEGITLLRTCYACPEQYDAKDSEGRQCGYLRLRHGGFAVWYPDVGEGRVIYRAEPRGDGIFEDDEREHYLTAAVRAIKAHESGGKRCPNCGHALDGESE